jgi:hypothetical protein
MEPPGNKRHSPSTQCLPAGVRAGFIQSRRVDDLVSGETGAEADRKSQCQSGSSAIHRASVAVDRALSVADGTAAGKHQSLKGPAGIARVVD